MDSLHSGGKRKEAFRLFKPWGMTIKRRVKIARRALERARREASVLEERVRECGAPVEVVRAVVAAGSQAKARMVFDDLSLRWADFERVMNRFARREAAFSRDVPEASVLTGWARRALFGR